MLNDDAEPLLIIKPAIGLLVVIGIAVSFGVLAGIASLVFGVSRIEGAALFVAAIVIWLSVSTVRIKLYRDGISKDIFWRKIWRFKYTEIEIHDGSGGDLPIIPAFVLKRGGIRVGEILKTQFSAQDISKFTSILKDLGVEIRRKGGGQDKR